MYTFFVFLHIIVAGVWFSTGVASIAIDGLRKKAAGTLGELYLTRGLVAIGGLMGNIGGVGILISGLVLTMMDNKGIFPFGTLNWLAWKQSIFVVLLVMVGTLIVPKVKNVRRMIGEELAGPNASSGASTSLREGIHSLNTVGRMMWVLVTINMILGVWKPNL